jgi:predicted acylesterase/phospholipase RssA
VLERFRTTHGVSAWSVVAGSGAGAFIAALLAQDRWTELVALYAGLDPRGLLRPRYAHLKGRPHLSACLAGVMRAPSLFLPAEGLPRLVEETVDARALLRSATEVHFVATDLRTGRPRSFCNRTDTEEDLLRGLLAAVSRPILLPPVHVGADRHPCVDGSLFPGAALVTCFKAIRRYGGPVADRILAVSTTPEPPEDPQAGRGDLLAVGQRVMALLTGDGGRGAVRHAALTSALARIRERLGPAAFDAAIEGLDPEARAHVERAVARRAVPVLHVRPSAGGSPPFDARAAMREGSAAAERAFA